MAKAKLINQIPEEIVQPIDSFVDVATDTNGDDDALPAFKEEEPTSDGSAEHYYEAVGHRKEAIARVRLMTKKSGDPMPSSGGLIIINGKDYREYFADTTLNERVEQPLVRLKSLDRFKATVKVSGGGLSGQADAVRHGISRALELFDQNFRKRLKKSGYLTRDPRAKERRKFGLKKARKAPQWSKR